MYKDRNGMEIEVMLNEDIVNDMQDRLYKTGQDDIVTDFVKALIAGYLEEKRLPEGIDENEDVSEDSCFAGSVYLYCPLRVLAYIKENYEAGIIPESIGKYIVSDFASF